MVGKQLPKPLKPFKWFVFPFKQKTKSVKRFDKIHKRIEGNVKWLRKNHKRNSENVKRLKGNANRLNENYRYTDSSQRFTVIPNQ